MNNAHPLEQLRVLVGLRAAMVREVDEHHALEASAIAALANAGARVASAVVAFDGEDEGRRLRVRETASALVGSQAALATARGDVARAVAELETLDRKIAAAAAELRSAELLRRASTRTALAVCSPAFASKAARGAVTVDEVRAVLEAIEHVHGAERQLQAEGMKLAAIALPVFWWAVLEAFAASGTVLVARPWNADGWPRDMRPHAVVEFFQKAADRKDAPGLVANHLQLLANSRRLIENGARTGHEIENLERAAAGQVRPHVVTAVDGGRPVAPRDWETRPPGGYESSQPGRSTALPAFMRPGRGERSAVATRDEPEEAGPRVRVLGPGVPLDGDVESHGVPRGRGR